MIDREGDREVQELAKRFGLDAMRLITSYQFLVRSIALRSTGTPLGSDVITDTDVVAQVDAEVTQSLRSAITLGFGITPDDVVGLVRSLHAAVGARRPCELRPDPTRSVL